MKMGIILIFVSSFSEECSCGKDRGNIHRQKYNTKQKALLAAFFREHGEKSFTPDEVASALPDVPKSTVYRTISNLEAEGEIRRTGTEGRAFLYQYQGSECPGHMHIRCILCGRTEHLDAGTTEKVAEIIRGSSGFTAVNTTIFDGICRECREKRK